MGLPSSSMAVLGEKNQKWAVKRMRIMTQMRLALFAIQVTMRYEYKLTLGLHTAIFPITSCSLVTIISVILPRQWIVNCMMKLRSSVMMKAKKMKHISLISIVLKKCCVKEQISKAHKCKPFTKKWHYI